MMEYKLDRQILSMVTIAKFCPLGKDAFCNQTTYCLRKTKNNRETTTKLDLLKYIYDLHILS